MTIYDIDPAPSSGYGISLTAISNRNLIVVGSHGQAFETGQSTTFVELKPFGDTNDVTVTGVNSSGVAVGSGPGYAYIYNGNYTRLQNNPSGGTLSPLAINDAGTIFGQTPNGQVTVGFELAGTTYKQFSVPQATSTFVVGQDVSGDVAGTYSSGGRQHGVIFRPDGTLSTIDVPGAQQTTVSGINRSGTIVGSYLDSAGNQHGFIDQGGQTTTFDYPGSSGTALIGIQDSGAVLGFQTVNPYDPNFLATPEVGTASSPTLRRISQATSFGPDTLYTYYDQAGDPVLQNLYLASPPGSPPVLLLSGTVTKTASGGELYNYTSGLQLLGKAYSSYTDLHGPYGALRERTFFDAAGNPLGQLDYNADGSVYLSSDVSRTSNGEFDYHGTYGSFLDATAYASVDTIKTAAGVLVSQIFRNVDGAPVIQTDYNPDGSILLSSTVTETSAGNFDYHATSGSYFTGKPFASLDKIETAAGVLVSETFNNPDGSPYEQIAVSTDSATSDQTYHFQGGSFFTGKPFSAFDNLATLNDILLAQTIDNTDGSHTFTVPGSNLMLAAIHNDTFTVTGKNETVRFGATGFGADLFKGYSTGDTFSFAPSVFADFAAVQQHATGATNAVITDASGDSLTINGVASSSLTAGMFKFA